METLYLTDLDGTLLDSRGRLSVFSARALRTLYEAGVAVSVATGRSWSALDVLEGAPFRAPMILLGGARIYDAASRAILREHVLPLERVMAVLDVLRGAGLWAMMYTQDAQDVQRVYYEHGAPVQMLDYVARQRAQGDDRFCAVDRLEDKLNEKVFYLTARGERSYLQPLVERMRAPDAYTYLYYGVREKGGCFVEICPVSKRVGVEELRRLTGAQRIVAFGDNGNDEGLFEGADVRVAVENATPGLLSMAHRVIGPHDQDAVVREIARMEGVELV